MPGDNSSLNIHENSNLSNLHLQSHGMEMMSEFTLKSDHSVVDASIVDESSIVDASVVDLPQLRGESHHEFRLPANSPKNSIDAIVNHEIHSHSSETTTIDGVVYNSRGYEVCGHLNQHNKPCQRIGRCPFHSGKDKKDGELSPTPSNHSGSQESTPPAPAPSIPAPAPPTALAVQMEKKEPAKTPMKTPYKQGWTKDEHIRFLNGLQIHGKGAWKEIAQIVSTRTPTQIQSHAQKYYLRQKQPVKNKRSIHDLTIEDLQEMDSSMRGGHKSHVSLVPNGNPNSVSLNNRPAIQYSYTTMIPGPTHGSTIYQTTTQPISTDPNMVYYPRTHMQGPMMDQNQYSQMRSPQMQTIHMQNPMQAMQMQGMPSLQQSMGNNMSSMQMPTQMPSIQHMSNMTPMATITSMSPMTSMSSVTPLTSMQSITPMQSISPMQNMQSMQQMPSAYSHIGGSHLPAINQVAATPTQLPSMHYNWYSPTQYSYGTSYSQHISTGPMQGQMMQASDDRHSLPSSRHDETHKDYWPRNQNGANGNDSASDEDENSGGQKRFPDFLTQDDNPREKRMRRIVDDEEEKEEEGEEDEEGEDDSNQFLVAEGDD